MRAPEKAGAPETDGIDDDMRKPLVLACVAAAALAAGGITATALAQASPDVPEVPDVQLYGEPMLPDPDDAAFAEPSAPAGKWVGEPGPDPVSKSPVRVSKSPAAKEDKAETPEPKSPKNRDKAEVQRQPQPDAPARDAIAGAREAVTARDISNSPAAPVQQQVLALVNKNRRAHGCDSLTPDRRLIEAANEHAADMAKRGYFAHEDRQGERAGSRVAGAGYEWKRYGENIARGQKSPFEVVSDWMDSPAHRENILDCRLDQMGVGFAIAGDDTPYWVQDFATPR